MKRTEQYTFFWGTQDPFSNWHPAPFIYKGIPFAQSEQWMMYCKAKLFGDEEMAKQILLETDPEKNKKQGRSVQGFVEEVWNEKARHYVYVGCREKFTQNPVLLQALLSTEGTELVEASPFDKIWGVGLRDSDPRILDRAQWQGTNWLGEVLTRLRDDLLRDMREKEAQAEPGPTRRGPAR